MHQKGSAKKVQAGHKVVAVVSAMGKTTDHLVELAGNISSKPDKREMDMLLATGEQQSMALMSMSIREMGHEAISLTGWQAGITTEDIHGNARIEDIEVSHIKPQLKEHSVVIVAGFQGVTSDGQITTLGRGGSDTSAVALAAALDAQQCEIYTDVSGVFTTDPRYVPTARKLNAINFDEMLELANLGAGVLHPRAVENAKKYKVPLVVRSSFLEEEGTIIKEEIDMENAPSVRGLAFEKDVTKITLLDLNNEHTTLSKVFTALADAHVDVDIIIQNMVDQQEASLSFTVGTESLETALPVLKQHQEELGCREIQHESDLAKVSIVGTGMISNPGVAAQMFNALAESEIEVKMVSTSEIKVSTVIPAEQVETSLNILHSSFNLDRDTAAVVTG